MAGALVQGGVTHLGFRHPRYFWPLLTAGLSLLGLVSWPNQDRRARASLPELGLGALTGVGTYLVVLLGAVTVSHFGWGRRSLQAVGECSRSLPRGGAALLAIPAAAGEELFWREQCRRMAGDGVGEWPALARVTSVYAATQSLSRQPLPPLGGVLLSLAGGALQVRQRSIWPAVVAHVVFSELCLVAPGLPWGLAVAQLTTEPSPARGLPPAVRR